MTNCVKKRKKTAKSAKMTGTEGTGAPEMERNAIDVAVEVVIGEAAVIGVIAEIANAVTSTR